MKAVSFNPFSALAGAGLLGLVLLATGAFQAPIRVQPFPSCHGLIRVSGIPDPRQMVVIKEGTPFVVPAGKVLAITGLGATHDVADVTIRVDDQDEFSCGVRLPYGNGTTITEPPPGFTAHAGSTVEVIGGGLFGCAWGYLADAEFHAPGLVRVAGIPDPRSMVVIREGAPFIVPAGKMLTITGLGSVVNASGAQLQVDGINEFVAVANSSYGSSCSIRPVPPGLAIQAGSNVAVAGVTARAWGYLVDA